MTSMSSNGITNITPGQVYTRMNNEGVRFNHNAAVSESPVTDNVQISRDIPYRDKPSEVRDVDFETKGSGGVKQLGFDNKFLGTDMPVDLPTVTEAYKDQVLDIDGKGDTVREYTHFSIVMNKDRRLCFFTACNIDGSKMVDGVERGKWIIDDQVGYENQLGSDIYGGNNLDKGHMVRRRSVAWGTPKEAVKASDDTFHYTNAAPQHARLNQKEWLRLENWILENADEKSQRLSEFTGPIFKEDDIEYRGAKIPAEFWKVIVVRKPGEDKPSAAAFMLSQEDLLGNLKKGKGRGDDIEVTEVQTSDIAPYQVTIKSIEEATGLDFGDLKEVDAFALYDDVRKAAFSLGNDSINYNVGKHGQLVLSDMPDTSKPRLIRSSKDIII